jgi:GNAT superfamily N-acetyltransferase
VIEPRPFVSRVPLTDPRVTILLTDLAREYVARYGSAEELSSTVADDFDPPHGTFLVVTDAGGATLAGGGLRRIDTTTCEIKRMWASPAHRRQGLASTVLAALEASALDLGYATVCLETGPSQPEAAALYARAGYRRIPVYGSYPRALAFEKDLVLGRTDG